MLKLKMMLCVMMLPLVVVVAHQRSSLSVSACSTTASGVDNAASRLADTAEQDYFTLRGADTMPLTGRNPGNILMSSADRVAHIDGQLITVLANSRSTVNVNALIMSQAIILRNVCWVSVLTTFSAPPQILAASTVSSANSRNEKK